jgi:RNA polymerase sigma-70 factor (ECF subfamily)
MTLTDEELALLVQNGDKEKFGFLMERYEKKLLRYGGRFLSNQDNVEDVVQEIFIKTYRSIQGFDVKMRFSPWIYRIAHNMFVNALKKKSRSPLSYIDFDTLISHPIYEDPVPAEEEQKKIKEMIDKSLDSLDQKYREILILFYIEELEYKEIAEILRIPVGTVGIRLSRARDALKKTLPKNYDHQ